MFYYISDLHFGHKNCLEFDHRPFQTIDEMDACLIDGWNRIVTDLDDVWIVGDICYRSEKSAAWYLQQLKGHKHLILGNHDWTIKDDPDVIEALESIDSLKRIEDDGKIIILCHYPLAVWDQKHRGSYHVYGHVHSKIDDATKFMLMQEHAFNAGCMVNGYVPCTLSQLEKNTVRRLGAMGIKAL